MALDALCVKALVCEFNKKLSGLRLDKIYQPESDELIISLHGPKKAEKLLLSANANIPRACLTKETRENPSAPPMFCMLLRKHLAGGKLIKAKQPDFERVIEFKIETKNDFGDLVTKTLVIEIMGRHSNIILLDENNKILGSIKHVDFSVSSVRQILPGLIYSYPPAQDKTNPLLCSLADFTEKFKEIPDGTSADKFISSSFLGISSLSSREICYLAGINSVGSEIDFSAILDLATSMNSVFSKLANEDFSPCIIENAENGKLMDFSAIAISQYGSFAKVTSFDSISEVIDTFYKTRAIRERMAIRSANLTKLVSNNIARCAKKYEIQSSELKQSAKKEKYRYLGELITSNIYKINRGDESVAVTDYCSPDLKEITIPLDSTLTPSANAQKYFKRYNKLKNAEAYLTKEIENTKSELIYLETVEEELKNAKTLSELSEIREELASGGYIKQIRQNPKKKKSAQYTPQISSFETEDGFTVFIGKNNKQNDYLTTKMSRGTDLWFHTKDIPGSHVVIRHRPDTEFSDTAILAAARAAAFNSKAKNSDNVPVDYTLIKNVKKPSGARPGFVIFTDNKTLYVTPKDYE